MSEKIPKLSPKLYQKLAQLFSESNVRSAPRITLSHEEKALHERYFKAFMSGQQKAEAEQDEENAA